MSGQKDIITLSDPFKLRLTEKYDPCKGIDITSLIFWPRTSYHICFYFLSFKTFLYIIAIFFFKTNTNVWRELFLKSSSSIDLGSNIVLTTIVINLLYALCMVHSLWKLYAYVEHFMATPLKFITKDFPHCMNCHFDAACKYIKT